MRTRPRGGNAARGRNWHSVHNHAMASYPPDVLARLDKVREIEIETTRTSGEKRRTTIWIVVDGEDVFIRSEYGGNSWWYRDITKRPAATVHPRDIDPSGPIEVRAIPADDKDSVESCSAAIARKYPPGGSVNVMTRSPAIEATLRLEPA
jgi:hypothetical protein